MELEYEVIMVVGELWRRLETSPDARVQLTNVDLTFKTLVKEVPMERRTSKDADK